MAVKKISYCYVMVPNRAGQGIKVLQALREAGVNLLAYSGFPSKGKAQLDLIPEDMTALRRLARQEGWRLSKVKKAFLVRGTDRLGAVHRLIDKLATKKINVVAADAVSAAKRQYAMILWVKPKDYARASRALRAR